MKKLLITLFFAASALGAYAQALLGIGSSRLIYSIQDTVCDGYTDTYLVYIKNKGNLAFNDVIVLNCLIDSGSTPLIDGFPDTLLATLSPGDSVPMYHTHTYNGSDVFRMGGNIVVIWPSSQTANTSDTSFASPVFVENCNSVAEIADERTIQIYPNPSSGNVSVISRGHESDVRSIKLMDVSGRELLTLKNTNIVSLQDYADGIYFLEVTFSDKSQKTFKIIRKE